jgi:WD40 repeat protein
MWNCTISFRFSLFLFISLFLFFSSFFLDHNSMDEISNDNFIDLWLITLDLFLVLATDKFSYGMWRRERQSKGTTQPPTTHQFTTQLFLSLFSSFFLLNWLRRYSDHTQRVNSIGLNPDGTVVVSASYDSTIKLWDCRSLSKRPIQTLTDAKDSVESVSIQDYEIISG